MELPLIILILNIILLLGVVVLIALQLRKKEEDRVPEALERIERGVAEEFARSRADVAGADALLRQETAAQIGRLDARLDAMEKHNLEHELQLNRMLNGSLTETREKTAAQIEKLTAAIADSLEKIRTGNEQKLEQMRVTVSEKLDETLQKRLDASFETVSKQLESLYKSLGEMKELSVGVTDHVSALNRVLTNVKARGTWAEVQLGAILDQILPGRYVENFSPKGSQNHVEYAVAIPSGDGKLIYLPIDSKFPMEDYIRIQTAAENADPAALAEARKALRTRILNEAKDVSTKYISVPETTPFAVLYLATEGLYAEAVSMEGLAEKLHSEYSILLAGPSTVTALLNSLAMGFRTIAVNEKAEEIRKMLGAIRVQYDKFNELLERAQKKVGEAGDVLESAQKRSLQITKKLKAVDAADPAEADALLFAGAEDAE